MGVPVVTLGGDRHASRVGCSLLTHAGLPELIAHSTDEFVAIACALARSPQRLATYRSVLRQQMSGSVLLDAESMARRFESVMRGMWLRYCESDAARAAGIAAASGWQAKMKLHIGGKQFREGWKILDVQPGPNVDFVGDIRSLEGFSDESCSEIYCSHVLQHLPVNDIVPALKSLHRILAPGGRLMISVPDFDVLVALFQRSDLDLAQRFRIMRMVFGGQMDPFDFHCVGLTFDFLVGYLAQAGFSSVEQVESFDLFSDGSKTDFDGTPISLNVMVGK